MILLGFLFCFLFLKKRLSRLILCQIHYFDNKRHSLHLNIFYLFLRNRTLLFGYSPGTKNKYLQFNTDYYSTISIYYIWKAFEKWIHTGRQNQYFEVRNYIFFLSCTCLIVVSNKTCTVLHLTLYKWLLSHDICCTIGIRPHGMICVLLFSRSCQYHILSLWN